MSVELSLNTNRTRVVNEAITTDRVWVSAQMYDFAAKKVVFEVSYGFSTDPEGRREHSEIWIASGPPLVNFMTEAPVGATRLDVLRDISEDLITTITSTPGLKDQLIADGHLQVVGGSLWGGLHR